MLNREEQFKKKEELIAKFGDDFGLFIKTKREQRGMSIRGAAAEIEITAAYLSDIEKGKEKPPTQSVIERMACTYLVRPWEKEYMLEMSAKCRGQVSKNIALFLQDSVVGKAIINMLASAYNELDQDVAEAVIKKTFNYVEDLLEKPYKEKFPEMYADEPKDEDDN